MPRSSRRRRRPGTRAATIRIGAGAGLAVLEAPGNPHVRGSSTMLDRGHLDHVAFDVAGPAELEEVRRRVVALGAGDGTVSDYGPMLSVYFVDPDGMGTEACWLHDPTFTGAHAPEPFTGDLRALASPGRPEVVRVRRPGQVRGHELVGEQALEAHGVAGDVRAAERQALDVAVDVGPPGRVGEERHRLLGPVAGQQRPPLEVGDDVVDRRRRRRGA